MSDEPVQKTALIVEVAGKEFQRLTTNTPDTFSDVDVLLVDIGDPLSDEDSDLDFEQMEDAAYGDGDDAVPVKAMFIELSPMETALNIASAAYGGNSSDSRVADSAEDEASSDNDD